MVMGALLDTAQRWLLFPSYLTPQGKTPVERPGELEHFGIETEEGRTEAFFLPARGGGKRPALIFAHGNAELAEQWIPVFDEVRARGVHVLLPEYRGYGRSTGSPSERSIRDDFVRFHDRLVAEPTVDQERVIYVGRSLGGGAVGVLARERCPRALVLMNTFTSVTEMAGRYGVPRSLLRDRFETLEAVRVLGVPTLVVHGKRDTIVPFTYGRRLAEECQARLVTLDAGHNDCFPDEAVLVELLMSFLAETGIHR
jgi:pimeloyl-ACP methyl ester carboxylesterase